MLEVVDAQTTLVQARNAYGDGLVRYRAGHRRICRHSRGHFDRCSKIYGLRCSPAARSARWPPAVPRRRRRRSKRPLPVQVTAVTQDTIRRIVAGDGVLFPLDQQNVMPKISAPVQKFYVNRGDHVKQGQLLAVLENRDLDAAAAESKGAGGSGRSQSAAPPPGPPFPKSVVKAQTDVRAAQQAARCREEGAGKPRAAARGGRARAQAGGRSAGSLRAGQQPAADAAQEHLRALQSRRQSRSRSRPRQAQVEAAKAQSRIGARRRWPTPKSAARSPA